MTMKKTKTTTSAATGVTRRTLLKTGAAAAGAVAGSGLITGFPTIWAQNPITLRQFGTGVSNINAIAREVQGRPRHHTLEMTATDSDAAAQRAVTQPDSYDIADIEYWILKKVFPSGVLQPMDTSKLKYFDKVVPLFINGKLKPDFRHRAGHGAAHGRLRRGAGQQDLRQGTHPVVHHDADDLQCRYARHPPRPRRPRDHHLGRHHGPAFKGKTSILNIPSIGIMDAAMIMEATARSNMPTRAI